MIQWNPLLKDRLNNQVRGVLKRGGPRGAQGFNYIKYEIIIVLLIIIIMAVSEEPTLRFGAPNDTNVTDYT